MITKAFPYNTVINSVEWDGANEILVVNFARGTRKYRGATAACFYKLYYMVDLKSMLSYYATNIRKKFDLIK